MATLKITALAVGSLALFQGAAAAAGNPEGTDKTGDVIDWINLFRNAKIDVQLPSLDKVTDPFVEKVTEFLSFPQENLPTGRSSRGGTSTTPKQCTVVGEAYKKGLLLKLSDGDKIDYGALFDAALNEALPKIKLNAGKVPEYQDTNAGSISFMSSETPTHVGCGITTNCTEKYLFCKFATSATGSFINTPVVVTEAFAQALEARKNANVKIAELKPTDANTRLTSGVPKVACSALVMLAVAVSALL